MSQVGEIEKKTQRRVIQLFQDNLGYEYLGDWEHRPDNSNIEESLLHKYLKKQNYNDTLINKSIFDLTKIATNQNKSLYEINKELYGFLRYGIKEKENIGKTSETIHLIDWKNPDKNHFAIAEEVTISSETFKAP